MSKIQDIFLPSFRRTKRVVAEFDQSGTPEATTYPGGYCAGLAVHWFALRAANKDWPDPPSGPAALALSKAAAATYAKYLAGHGKALADSSVVGVVARRVVGGLGGIDTLDVVQLKGALSAVLGDVGMSIDAEFEPRRWNGGEGRTFIHDIAVLGSGLYDFGIACSQGSHALGLHVSSKRGDSPCEFFDPNNGQLHVADPDELKWSFDTLLRAYVSAYGFDFKSGYVLRLLPPKIALKEAP